MINERTEEDEGDDRAEQKYSVVTASCIASHPIMNVAESHSPTCPALTVCDTAHRAPP